MKYTDTNILHLVLFSKNEIYVPMYEITQDLYKRNQYVKTLYYIYDNTLENKYKLEGDILYIKGEEIFGPNITIKTLEAFEYFKQDFIHNKYDFIVRSNISTIVNLDLLQRELFCIKNNSTLHYGGGNLMNLNWIVPNLGIKDQTFFGTIFAQGTSIIFSNEFMKIMLENKNLIRKDIVDDISIGIFVKNNLTNLKPFQINNNYTFDSTNFKGNYELIKKNIMPKIQQLIFYRNRANGYKFVKDNNQNITEGRHIDIIQMKHIVNIIMKEYYIKPTWKTNTTICL